MTHAQFDHVLALLARLEATPTSRKFNKLARGVDDLMNLAPGDPELREFQIQLSEYVWSRITSQRAQAEESALAVRVMVEVFRRLTPETGTTH